MDESCIVQRRLVTTYKNNSGVGSVIVALTVDENKYEFIVPERREEEWRPIFLKILLHLLVKNRCKRYFLDRSNI
jgi:hypothetical protein